MIKINLLKPKASVRIITAHPDAMTTFLISIRGDGYDFFPCYGTPRRIAQKINNTTFLLQDTYEIEDWKNLMAQ